MPAPPAIGERAFVEAVRRTAGRPSPAVRVGIGDDAACVVGFPRTLLTTDTLVEGVHYRAEWLAPAALGRRAYRAAASDVGAMGGSVRYALLSLVLPRGGALAWARAVVRGLVREAEADGCALVGGNVAAGGPASVTVTLVGRAGRRLLTRAGAKAGDLVAVSGPLGDAAAGVELLERGERAGALVHRYLRPPNRLRLGAALARGGIASAAIDVSDGLLADLGRLARASGAAVRLEIARLPLSRALRRAAARGRLARAPESYALAGGDDYELLFAMPDGRAAARALRLGRRLGCEITVIGRLVGGPAGEVRGEDGRRLAGGFDHFARGSR